MNQIMNQIIFFLLGKKIIITQRIELSVYERKVS